MSEDGRGAWGPRALRALLRALRLRADRVDEAAPSTGEARPATSEPSTRSRAERAAGSEAPTLEPPPPPAHLGAGRTDRRPKDAELDAQLSKHLRGTRSRR